MISLLISGILLTNVSDMAERIRSERNGSFFRVEAVASTPYDRIRTRIPIHDETGAVTLLIDRDLTNHAARVMAGDHIQACGVIRPSGIYELSSASCTGITIRAHGPTPEPEECSAQSVIDGSRGGRFVSITGTVIDSFRDEIDRKIFFLVLDCDREQLCVLIASTTDITPMLQRLHNAEVRVRGICSRGQFNSLRRLTGPLIESLSLDDIEVLRLPGDLFNAPNLITKALHTPNDVHRLGRCRTSGIVLAIVRRKQVVIRTPNDETIVVTLSDGTPVPSCGQFIEVVGFAETDCFNVNLSHGIWRTSPDEGLPSDETPARISAKDIMTDENGTHLVNTEYHGRTVQIRGTVRSLSPLEETEGFFTLEDRGLAFSVDASSVPVAFEKIIPGSTVSLSGICIINMRLRA